jgi:hypothetical protein
MLYDESTLISTILTRLVVGSKMDMLNDPLSGMVPFCVTTTFANAPYVRMI